MFNNNPKCMWTYNCEKRDYDFSVDWGTVTIQRNNLHYIRITLFFWNEIDEWITKSSIFTPPNSPTSQPYTSMRIFTTAGAKQVKFVFKTILVKNISLPLLLKFYTEEMAKHLLLMNMILIVIQFPEI